MSELCSLSVTSPSLVSFHLTHSSTECLGEGRLWEGTFVVTTTLLLGTALHDICLHHTDNYYMPSA